VTVQTRDGEVMGTPRDGDDRVAEVLEACCDGEYLWIPFCQIQRMEVAEPKQLRDLVWLPASLNACGQSRDLFISVLYVDSYLHQDEDVRLGRRTDWQEESAGVTAGVGQRLLFVGEADVAVTDIRLLTVAQVPAGAGA